MNKKRNVAIDLLRVIAATLIVLHHYQQGVDITFEHIKLSLIHIFPVESTSGGIS